MSVDKVSIQLPWSSSHSYDIDAVEHCKGILKDMILARPAELLFVSMPLSTPDYDTVMDARSDVMFGVLSDDSEDEVCIQDDKLYLPTARYVRYRTYADSRWTDSGELSPVSEVLEGSFPIDLQLLKKDPIWVYIGDGKVFGRSHHFENDFYAPDPAILGRPLTEEFVLKCKQDLARIELAELLNTRGKHVNGISELVELLTRKILDRIAESVDDLAEHDDKIRKHLEQCSEIGLDMDELFVGATVPLGYLLPSTRV